MKLLLDENLSRRLAPLLQERFPESSQVCLLGLERASDREIWDYAKAHGFVVVTCDSDFEALSLLYGAPPAVIRLKSGNLSRAAILALLNDHHALLRELIEGEGRARIELVK